MISRNKIKIFFISVLISVILLFTYQVIIYSMMLDSKDKLDKKIQYDTSIIWDMLEVVINESITTSQNELDTEIIPSILLDINNTYKDDAKDLSSDLKQLGSKDNKLTHILYSNIEGKYFNDIKTDSNDIFILTKKNGIIVDPSISTSSNKRPRSIEEEIADHYNEQLATDAFNTILEQNYQRQFIFRQFFEPENMNSKIITQMRMSELEEVFNQSNGDLSSLKSYEFMVPRYIHCDRDILGDKLVDERGVRQDIYQIILVQSFNISEIIENNSILYKIYKNIHPDNTYAKYQNFILLNRVQQIMLILGLTSIIFLIQFSIKVRNHLFNIPK